MKNFKKLVSIMLALVMAAAMALIPALAAEGEDSAAPTPTYEIYQIFTGEVVTENNENVLSNAKYGANINVAAIEALAATEGTGVTSENIGKVKVGEPVSKAVMDYFAKLEDGKTQADLAVALFDFVNKDSEPVTTVERKGTDKVSVTDKDIVPGYYLIKDQDDSQANEEYPNYTLYVVEVMSADNNTIVINPKVGTPKPDKVIVEDNKEKKDNDAAIGDIVEYKITGTMPANLDKYNTYYYEFADTLSKGLTYNEDSMVVKVGNVDIELNDDNFEVTKNDDGTTTIRVYFEDVKAIAGVDVKTVITLTYSATLNQDAEYKNDNDVKIVYSNDPNHSGSGDGTPDPQAPKGETPKSTVSTYTTELTINKVDADKNALVGAEFTLTGSGLKKVVIKTAEVFEEAADGIYYKLTDGTYTKDAPTEATADKYASTDIKYTKTEKTELVGEGEENTVVKGMVGTDGKITFFGLKEGEYTLEESITPEGYNTIKDIKFEIKYNGNGEFEAVNINKDETDGVTVEINNTNNVLETTVVNVKGSLLPSTGGIGTTIFYVVGSIVVAAAVVLLVVKSKKRAKAN